MMVTMVMVLTIMTVIFEIIAHFQETEQNQTRYHKNGLRYETKTPDQRKTRSKYLVICTAAPYAQGKRYCCGVLYTIPYQAQSQWFQDTIHDIYSTVRACRRNEQT